MWPPRVELAMELQTVCLTEVTGEGPADVPAMWACAREATNTVDPVSPCRGAAEAFDDSVFVQVERPSRSGVGGERGLARRSRLGGRPGGD